MPAPQIGGPGADLHFVNHPRPPAGSLYSGQDAPMSGQDAFKSAIIACKIPVKRLSKRFYRLQVASKSSRMPSDPFLGTEKSMKTFEKTMKLIGKKR